MRNDMTHDIIIEPASARPMDERAFEMCEHKGVGHPDTITDGVCEAASRALCRSYLITAGRILHHNLDKGLLLAGRSVPRFGGGRIVQPMRFVICGRATPLPDGGDASRTIVEAARRHLAAAIGYDAAPEAIVTEIGETSGDLMRLFGPEHAVPPANDTSFGTGFAPYSRLERAVLELARVIKSEAFRARFPAAGTDFKIMGCRLGETMTLTLALAFVDRHVEGVGHYLETKRAMRDYLVDILNLPVRLRINLLDDPQARDERGLYLTVSGLSGEMGDDGQVGRGNRVSGLITPGRPMSLEATAGKNPVSHVGKLYNVLATLVARDVYKEVEGAQEVSVQLLSAIGAPVDRPQLAAVDIAARIRLSTRARARAKEIVATWLADIPKVTASIVGGQIALY